MTTENLEKYGLPGIAIAGLCWFIMYLMREHRKERQQAALNDREDRKETARAIQGFTEALTKISVLIEKMK